MSDILHVRLHISTWSLLTGDNILVAILLLVLFGLADQAVVQGLQVLQVLSGGRDKWSEKKQDGLFLEPGIQSGILPRTPAAGPSAPAGPSSC